MNTSEDTELSPFNEKALTQTRDHLKLLGVFYIILGLMALPTLLFLAFHGAIIDQILQNAPDQETRELIERLVNVSVVGFVLMVIVHVVTCVYVGVWFRNQRHHTICIVAAAFCCLSFPLGTILGVFSLIVLMKPEAKYLFGVAPPPA
jgi:uncharacterized BrkB/YihY/UPF0761 family membrane protein